VHLDPQKRSIVMHRTVVTLIALALAVATSAAVEAATLVSPPLVPEGTNFLDCYLVNVGEKPRAVTIQVFSREGTVVKTVETTLDPGEEDVARATSEENPRYCKFIVKGSARDFRASILVRQDGVGAISALPAN
jgi:hypothetical protein